MLVKPLSVLAIVALGQINYFFQHHANSKKNFATYKENKDNKKIIAPNSEKQLSARMRNLPAIISQIKILQNYLQEEIIQNKIITLEISRSKNFDFNNFRLIWFGCCK